MLRKLISYSLILIIVLSLIPVSAFAAANLPSAFTNLDVGIGSAMPFKPPHKYICRQNPPDFTWPQISGAKSYELGIFADEALTDLRYSKINLPYSYHSFTYPFEPGTYWWAIRYTNSSGQTSSWSVPRRFTLDTNYHEFKVIPAEDIVAAIPQSHPRIWFTQDTLEDFRQNARTVKGYDIYGKMYSLYDTWKDADYPEDPYDSSKSSGVIQNWGTRLMMAALCYHLTDNEAEKPEMLEFSVGVMKKLLSWEYDDATDSTNFSANDIAYFELMFRVAMGYDWLYNEMSEEDREIIKNGLIGRFDYVKDRSLNILRSNPYNSHIWSYFNAYGITAMALLHDVEWVNDYMVQMLDLQAPNFPPMSVEDGGWSKGTRYWGKGAFTRDKWFIDCLQYGGYMNYYDKMWAQNETLWALYMYPDNSYGSFGDGSNMEFPDYNHVMGLSKLGKYAGNPTAYWLRNKIGSINSIQFQSFDALMYADTFGEDGEAPKDYPKSHVFVDQGTVGMHSTLLDSDRISLYFRSGKYGSYNHMHADQNSFIIEAFGERLAIKSGFYDSYHTYHDKNITRQTFAHNSVTYNGGNGQKDDSMDANGNIDNFLTHFDFDLAVGDATKAYTGNIGRFVRSIIYLRPDSYIVIDELDAKEGEEQTFEWWLNAPTETMTVDSNSANIRNANTYLGVNLIYPDNLTGHFMQDYTRPTDGEEILPAFGYTGRPPQDRLYYQTEAVSDTRIIATMNVNQGQEKYFAYQKGDNYIKISPYDDDTTAIYVRTAKDGTVTTEDGVTFEGTAAVINNYTAMLVQGTSLSVDGASVFESENEISAVLGKGQFSVSGNDDFKVKVNFNSKFCPYLVSMSGMREEDGRLFDELITAEGSISANVLTMEALKGHYMFTLNDLVPISSDGLIPENITVSLSREDKAFAAWDANSNYKYDIMIDGTVFENVKSPYEFTFEKDSVSALNIRTTYKNIISEWSDTVYFDYGAEPKFSYTNITVMGKPPADAVLNAGDVINTDVNISGADFSRLAMITAQYDLSGALVDMDVYKKDFETKDQVRMYNGTKILSDGNTFKSFMWDSQRLIPFTTDAYLQDEAVLVGITLDGEPLVDFKPDVLEYTHTLDSTGEMPVVKGVTDNGAVYTTTAYSSTDTTGSATVSVVSPTGNKKEYKVNFVLPEGTDKIVGLLTDFVSHVKGKTYEEYCDYVEGYTGTNPDNGFTMPADTTRPHIYKIPDYVKPETFTVGGKLCYRNNQRIVTEIELRSGFENSFYIGPDPAMWQYTNLANWISSAYSGYISTETVGDTAYSFDFRKCSVPWYSFKVTRDCTVTILAPDKPLFLKEDAMWKYTRLQDNLYSAVRTTTGETLTPHTNMYVRRFKAGDTVELYNSCSGEKFTIGYMTLVDFD